MISDEYCEVSLGKSWGKLVIDLIIFGNKKLILYLGVEGVFTVAPLIANVVMFKLWFAEVVEVI